MSNDDAGKYVEHSKRLAQRFAACRVPEFAHAVPVGGVFEGATWWLVTRHADAANDAHGTTAEHFAREGVRLRAATFNLRLSQCIHDDAWSH